MRPTTCPAVRDVITETRYGGGAVICGIVALENGHEQLVRRVSPVITEARDPSSIEAFCAGEGVPGAENSYCACPVWRGEKERLWRRRAGARFGAKAVGEAGGQ
jgi:hypothetical protein